MTKANGCNKLFSDSNSKLHVRYKMSNFSSAEKLHTWRWHTYKF